MNRDELIKQFQKARCKGWEVEDGDFPESILEDFFPDRENLFKALENIAPTDVRYVILGQDPYPSLDPDTHAPQATGIAFAVNKDCSPPQSLGRIMDRIYGKGKGRLPDLSDWIAENKVLLLNASLTVPKKLETGQKVRSVAGKHLRCWEPFIERIICQLEKIRGAEFYAWGLKPESILKKILGGNRYDWCNHPMASSGNRPFKTFEIPGVIPWERVSRARLWGNSAH